MDKFYRIPIPIDHTATTKPRRKTKRKGKARGMVKKWPGMVTPKITTMPADRSWDGYLILRKDGTWWETTKGGARFFAEEHKQDASLLALTFGCRLIPVTLSQTITARSLPAPAGKGGGT